MCWACDAPIDPSKPVKPFEEKEEEVFVEEGVKEEGKGKSNVKLQK